MESEQSPTKMSITLLPLSLSLTSSSAVRYLGERYSSNDSDIINNQNYKNLNVRKINRLFFLTLAIQYLIYT